MQKSREIRYDRNGEIRQPVKNEDIPVKFLCRLFRSTKFSYFYLVVALSRVLFFTKFL